MKTKDKRTRAALAIALTITLATLALAPAACTTGNTSGSRVTPCRDLQATRAVRPPGWGGTVFTIVLENRSREDIFESPHAPYLNALSRAGAIATGYHTSYVHPSEPNYLWMVAGENFGILDDDDPSPHRPIASRSHLADQIEHAGLTWKSYQESMGDPCGLSTHGDYAPKHDPFVYFQDVNGADQGRFHPSPRCTDHVVDYAALDGDLQTGHVPDYVFITPNLDNDMHDGSIADGDRWLAREVPKILASSAYQHGGVLFVVWDEGEDDRDDPPFFVVSPNAKMGFVSETSYDTSSFLKTVEAILGVEPLPCDPDPGAVKTMDDLFTVPIVSR